MSLSGRGREQAAATFLLCRKVRMNIENTIYAVVNI